MMYKKIKMIQETNIYYEEAIIFSVSHVSCSFLIDMQNNGALICFLCTSLWSWITLSMVFIFYFLYKVQYWICCLSDWVSEYLGVLNWYVNQSEYLGVYNIIWGIFHTIGPSHLWYFICFWFEEKFLDAYFMHGNGMTTSFVHLHKCYSC